MLAETRDTLTVPASFMLRMLASINRVRAGASRHSAFKPLRSLCRYARASWLSSCHVRFVSARRGDTDDPEHADDVGPS